jgi:hypothetical protein
MGATDKVLSNPPFFIVTMAGDFTDSHCKAQFGDDRARFESGLSCI